METKTSVVKKAFAPEDKKTGKPSTTSLSVDFENGDWGYFKLIKGEQHPFEAGKEVTYCFEQPVGKKYGIITLTKVSDLNGLSAPTDTSFKPYIPSSYNPIRPVTTPEELKVYASISMMSELIRSFADDKLDLTFIQEKQKLLKEQLWDQVDEAFSKK
jgi:hypothetical protein